ncbi:sporulation protein YpjB [Paenibacillus methanolicus]|uniref:sporulation protein YpjB n=1 Tax=Paenibacillus methanolicus TaxID=582686 RepID=UPI00165337B1|nr:sporulation protein YpjB [Paenibacillus methanolicus]
MRRTIGATIVLAAILMITAGCASDWARTTSVHESAQTYSRNAVGGDKAIKIADELYSAANKGNRQLAYTALVQLERESKRGEVRAMGTLKGWQAFDASIQSAKKAFAQRPNGGEAYLQAARLKLAIDALYRSSPLWLQYQHVIQEDLERLRQAWVIEWEDRSSAELAALNVLRIHAERFEVAALLERPEADVTQFQDLMNRMEYAIVYAAKSSGTKERNRNLDRVWLELQNSVDVLFNDNAATKAASGELPDAAAAGPAPTRIKPMVPAAPVREQLATMFIAAFVMGVLAFVGWQRYKFEESHGASYPPPKSPWERDS